jgi:hypothetical protein
VLWFNSVGIDLPRIKNFDFRLEGIYTNMPDNSTNNLFYVNYHYPNGYRNYGEIIRSWIGRGGNGGQASTTYWFSAHNQATVTYRRTVTDVRLLNGGNVHDLSGPLRLDATTSRGVRCVRAI